MSGCSITSKADKVGLVFSLACALHCFFVPLLLPFLLAKNFGFFADIRVEWTLVGITVAIGLFSFITGYWNYHRKLYPLIILALGIVLFFYRQELSAHYGMCVYPLVGLFLMFAHALNLRLCYSCRKCSQEEDTCPN